MNQLIPIAVSTVMFLGTMAVDTAKQVVATPVLAAETPVVEVIEPPTATSTPECSCVVFARQYAPWLPLGDAKDLEPNSPFPRVGGVVIINYDGTYHVAYQYDKVSQDGWIPIHDFNFKPCQEMWRTIHINDPRIIGYRVALD